jgi:hypothetical protein
LRVASLASVGSRAAHLAHLSLLAALAAGGGCQRDEPQPAAAKPPSVSSQLAELSPAEVVRAAHAARWSGRQAELLALIVAEQRGAVLELVLAVDQLIAAEDVLQEALRATIGEGSAERFRQRRQVANIIGPFSRDVEIISERSEAEQAEVMIQVAGRVPLERVDLVRPGSNWLIRTDDPIPGLAAALSELAAVTRRFASDVVRGRMKAEALERELALRQTPVLRRVAQLTADAEGKRVAEKQPQRDQRSEGASGAKTPGHQGTK